MKRAQRILQYLFAARRPCTHNELRDHAVPGCTSNQVSTALYGLMRYGKVVNGPMHGSRNTYIALDGTPDRRKKKLEAPVAPPIVVAPPPPEPTARAPEPETIDQFLARGGRIQHLRNGDVSQPLRHIGPHAEHAGRPARRGTRAPRPGAS